MSGGTDTAWHHAWQGLLLRVGVLGVALHAVSLAIVGTSREPETARIAIMLAAACFVASVWAGFHPLTATRNPLHMVEALGTALLAVAFGLLLGWLAAGGI